MDQKGNEKRKYKYFELKENENIKTSRQADSRIHLERRVKTKTRWNHTIVTFNHATKRGNSWA